MTIIQKFEVEPKKGMNRFNKKYIGFAVVILLILTIAEIWVSNSVAADGDKLEKISETQRSLYFQNQQLQNEIAKNRSLSYVASKSAELGFSTPESIEYIR